MPRFKKGDKVKILRKEILPSHNLPDILTVVDYMYEVSRDGNIFENIVVDVGSEGWPRDEYGNNTYWNINPKNNLVRKVQYITKLGGDLL